MCAVRKALDFRRVITECFSSAPKECSMSMTPRAGLEVAGELAAFIEAEALPGTGLEPAAFWTGVAAIFARFARCPGAQARARGPPAWAKGRGLGAFSQVALDEQSHRFESTRGRLPPGRTG